MSTIETKTNETIWKLYQFLGLHENPDGDTKLKLGEASVCRNWKITRDHNLKRRPGFKPILDLDSSSEHAIAGMWVGNVMGVEIGLAACNGHLYRFYANGEYIIPPSPHFDLGTLNTSKTVSFFPFDNIVYILNGFEYYSYDGTTFAPVIGYAPIVMISRAPNGEDGELFEEVNKLTGTRRVWFSPDADGTATYQLPETDLLSINEVINRGTGEGYSPLEYETSPENGTVTFREGHIPPRGVNTIEIKYTVKTNYRSNVTGMRYAELFMGSQDNTVFLYGNGTNKAIYSSIKHDDGQPSAEYFPDLNEIAVADSNTPITDMIRHNAALMCYKTTSAYRISFGLITLADENQKMGFYVVPVNKTIGNAAVGQVRLVLNAPVTLFGNDLYRWENTSPYSAEITRDERMAIRMSDRIYATLGGFVPEECYCYDDNEGQEYYIWYQGTALVYNYAADAWYVYTSPHNLTVTSMCNIGDTVLFGMSDGCIRKLDEARFCDDVNEPIDSYWESGSIDFGKPYQRKFISEIWVGVKPQAHSKVTITVMTDKKSVYTERVVKQSLSTFIEMNFGDFSFLTNRKPQVKKLKIKAKKFAFLKFVLKTDDIENTATVLMVDPKVRETGYVK